MRVVHVVNQGRDYQLAIAEQAEPALGPHDVRIRVQAMGVNRADLYQAEGIYPAPEGASPLLGLEVAGVVEAMGDQVRSLAEGERVMALTAGGGYAEIVCVPEWRVLSIPSSLTIEQAAALPEALFTHYLNLFDLGRIAPGEVLLIHGGASGIGHIGIQMAKGIGARIFATVGSEEKAAFCERLGAEAIHYKTQDFVTVIQEKTGGHGADLILDIMGGSYAERNLKALAQKGRLINIAVIEGSRAEISVAHIMRKQIAWKGSTLRTQKEEDIYAMRESIRSLFIPRIERGEIVPHLHAVLSAHQAMEAHQTMRNFQHMGKIVLKW